MDLILTKRINSTSQLNHCPLQRYEWLDPITGDYYETTVDESYANYITNGWQALAQEPNPLGVYTNCQFATQGRGKAKQVRTTKIGRRVITADSPVNCLQRLTQAQVNELKELI